MTANIEFVGHLGHVLTPEDEASLHSSLKLLSADYQTELQFWGKVSGLDADYLLVQAECHGGPLLPPTTLYSVDCGRTWHLLQAVDAAGLALCALVRGPFAGDPSCGYTVKGQVIREAVRLAAFVQQCDHACAVVPRGALCMDENGKVVANRGFAGLEFSKAGKLSSYFHRRPLEAGSVNPVAREHLDPTVDCMPSIQADIPKGVWRVTLDELTGTVFGCSLQYPGAVFYHKPHTATYGYYYTGDGQENQDLAFML